jgi:hypothetical protein
LNSLIHTTGIGFQSYRWPEIPSYYQEQLLHLGVQRDAYDTGKVLNLLLLARGEKLIYRETETLRHIGGVSRLHRARFKKSFAHRAKIWGKRLLGKDMEQVWGKPLRKEIEDYFRDLLQALHAERPLPLPPVLDDVEIATKLNQVTHELTVLYAEYRP